MFILLFIVDKNAVILDTDDYTVEEVTFNEIKGLSINVLGLIVGKTGFTYNSKLYKEGFCHFNNSMSLPWNILVDELVKDYNQEGILNKAILKLMKSRWYLMATSGRNITVENIKKYGRYVKALDIYILDGVDSLKVPTIIYCGSECREIALLSALHGDEYTDPLNKCRYLKIIGGGGIRGLNKIFQHQPFVHLDLSEFEVSAKVTNLTAVFKGCKNLKTVIMPDIELSRFTSMEYMFCDCVSLEKIVVNNINTSYLISMDSMFFNCKKLKHIDLSWVKSNSLKRMKGLFCGCRRLESINFGNLDTSNVVTMESMFNNAIKPGTVLDLRWMDVSNVEFMGSMFKGCGASKILVDGWDVSNVTNAREMFAETRYLEGLDLSSFNLKSIRSGGMCEFFANSRIKHIKMDKMGVSGEIATVGMFNNCENLKSVKLFKFKEDKVVQGLIDVTTVSDLIIDVSENTNLSALTLFWMFNIHEFRSIRGAINKELIDKFMKVLSTYKIGIKGVDVSTLIRRCIIR